MDQGCENILMERFEKSVPMGKFLITDYLYSVFIIILILKSYNYYLMKLLLLTTLFLGVLSFRKGKKSSIKRKGNMRLHKVKKTKDDEPAPTD